MSIFAKRHYETIAHVLNTSGVARTNEWSAILREITVMLAKDNPAFKADKFIEAAYTGKHIRSSIP